MENFTAVENQINFLCSHFFVRKTRWLGSYEALQLRTSIDVTTTEFQRIYTQWLLVIFEWLIIKIYAISFKTFEQSSIFCRDGKSFI